MKHNPISAQVSLYPLRQTPRGTGDQPGARGLPRARAQCQARHHEHGHRRRSQCSLRWPESIVQTAAALGDVVMVASISNCCQAPAADRHNA